jgi:D-alanyl-D-alanine carboxypeptidase
MHKAELRLPESTKANEQFKRKQLFYLTQRDMAVIRSECFVVVEHPSGQIVTGSYYKKNVEIASLTKIMTFYVVLRLVEQHGVDIDKVDVTIDGQVADISGTSAELYEGDHYTVRQLLYGLMLPSGNDAAVALARWGGTLLGGDSKEFIVLMNRQAA